MIKRIQIQDYRSCLSTTFNLHPHLSVLIGPNGSGKTNILKAITLLRGLAGNRRFTRRSDEKPMAHCRLKVWFELGGKTAILTSVLGIDTDENNSEVIVSSQEQWNVKDFTGNQKKWNIPHFMAQSMDSDRFMDQVFLDIRHRHSGYRPYNINVKDFLSLPDSARKAIAKIAKYIIEMKYYSASQFTNPGNCPVSFELENESLRHRSLDQGRHTKFVYDLFTQFKTPKNKQYEQFIDIVGPNGIGLIHKILFKEIITSSVHHTVRAGGKVRERRIKKSLIIPQFIIGKHKLSPNQLSEGTFRTITLLFYLITEKSSLLLVEEPEVCVHHGLLSSIIELIKTYSNNKQIVISTHSDFVLDHVKPENVYKVFMEAKFGTKVTNIKNSMSLREFNALREYLDKEGNLGEYWKHGALD